MAKNYYTVCKYDTEARAWFDEAGFTTKREAREEIEFCHDDAPRGHVVILANDGTAADMIAKRDALAAPEGHALAVDDVAEELPRDMIHENRGHYVMLNRRCNALTVYKPAQSGTHAVSDSAYCNTDSGRGLAIARCDYLATRANGDK